MIHVEVVSSSHRAVGGGVMYKHRKAASLDMDSRCQLIVQQRPSE